MSTKLIHPDAWIGVPDSWPSSTSRGLVLETPEEWATALADEESTVAAIEPEARARLISILLMAHEHGRMTGSRVYLWFEQGWDGPARVLDVTLRRHSDLGGQELADLVGFTDPDQLGPPFTEPFETEHGVRGVRCYRYLPFDDHGIICGRLDYAFEFGDDIVTITGGDVDLVEFEKLKLAAEAFAARMVLDPVEETAADQLG